MADIDTQIIWVYGASGAGKETFIRHVLSGADPKPEISDFHGPVVACEESLRLIAQYNGDPVGADRERILPSVVRLAEENPGAAILIKGQDLDLQADRLNRLRSLAPHCRHRIVYLDADLQEQYRRVQRKPWYHPSITFGTLKSWYRWQIRALEELADNFHIEAFSSEQGDGYRAVPFPPEHD